MATRHSNGNGSVAAAAYYRNSSDKQEASLPAQRKAVQRFAKDNGYRIAQTYVDEAISGDATEKRMQFQRMIADAESGKFQAILCWDMDRFGRFDSIEAGRWIYPLRQAGVYLATVAQGVIDWTDFASRMMYGIQCEAKHAFLRDLSRNVVRGLIEKAKLGLWPNGDPPYGYVVGDDKRLALGDPTEVENIRFMFAEYLRGASLRGIAHALNKSGRLNRGKPWNRSSIRYKLVNEVYCGTFDWNDQPSGKYTRVVDIERISFRRLNNHVAIVSPETFQAVQLRIESRRTGCSTPKVGGGEFVLTKLLRCAKCDSVMVGATNRGDQFYLCGGHNQQGNAFCSRNSVKQTEVLDHVITAIESEYLNPKVIKRLRDELQKQVKQRTSKTDTQRQEKQLATVKAKIAKARRNLALVDPEYVGDVQATIRELQQHEHQLTDAVKATRTPRERRKADADKMVDEAIERFSRLRETLQKADKQLLREYLREAIESVALDVEKIPAGRKHRYELRGGTIVLKGSNLFSSSL